MNNDNDTKIIPIDLIKKAYIEAIQNANDPEPKIIEKYIHQKNISYCDKKNKN